MICAAMCAVFAAAAVRARAGCKGRERKSLERRRRPHHWCRAPRHQPAALHCLAVCHTLTLGAIHLHTAGCTMPYSPSSNRMAARRHRACSWPWQSPAKLSAALHLLLLLLLLLLGLARDFWLCFSKGFLQCRIYFLLFTLYFVLRK